MRVFTIEDCEAPRLPIDLRDWVDDKIAQVSRTRAGRNAFRLRRHSYAKWLMEEALPLSRFGVARFPGQTDVRLRPVLGDQPYDAEILNGRGLSFDRIEVTQTGLDREEHLRMLYLKQHGSVPLTGLVSETRGVDGKPVVEISRRAQNHETALQEILDQMRHRVEAKARKEYGSAVALLVAFSTLSELSQDDRAAVAEFAARELLPAAQSFPALFLVSTREPYLHTVFER